MPSIILSDNGVSSGSAGLKQTAGNDGVLVLQTTTSGGTATNAVYVDNSQNVGFGVVPSTSAWTTATATNAIQFGARGSLAYYAGVTDLCLNDAGGTYIVSSVTAARYRTQSGNHIFSSAPSGTAGAAITYTDVMKVGKDQTLALQGASSQSGTGITFPATASLSTNANTLDDYEEGTWTPTLSPTGTSFTSVTYTGQSGFYTKVGNVVTVWAQCFVNTISVGPATGYVTVSGLPFTVYNNAGAYAQGNLDAGNFTSNQPTLGIAIINTNHVQTYYRAASNASQTAQPVSSAANGCYVYFYVSYFTTQ